MEQKVKELIKELQERGESKYSIKPRKDPEATVNVWYVIAKLEEILLGDKKHAHVDQEA